MIQRLMTVTWLLNTEVPAGVQRRELEVIQRGDYITGLKSTFSARLGQEADAKTGYTTMSKAKGIKHSHDPTGFMCERSAEKETDCECR